MRRGMFGTDLIILIVVLFAVVLSVWVGSLVLDNMSTAFTAVNETEAVAIVDAGNSSMMSFDYGVPLVMIVGGIISLALSFRLNAHPIFFVISLIMLLIGVAFIAVLSNTFDELATNEFADQANTFSLSSLLFQNIHWFFIVFSLLIMIVMYSRNKGEAI